MESLNEALLSQDDSAILSALNQVSDDYIKALASSRKINTSLNKNTSLVWAKRSIYL